MSEDVFEPSHSPKFWSRVDKSGDCWIWQGSRRRDGYGWLQVDGKTRLAHRMAFGLATGQQPPGDLCVCHHCDNPSCVRPEHLFLGTMSDNTQDMIAKGRMRNGGTMGSTRGERNGRAKLSVEDVQAIRAKWAEGGRTLASLGREYGVSYVAIRYVVRGRHWQ